MSAHKDSRLHSSTAVIQTGFDPRLSVGSARPAVFRSSTYVFSSPEAAERAFAIATGRATRLDGENIELIYSRINHPNAEIFEDQVVPLESGAKGALVFNSGMAAIMTAILTFARPGDSIVYTTPLYGGTQHLIHQFLEPFGIACIPVAAGMGQDLSAAIAAARNLRIVFIESPANPTLRMTDIRQAADAAARRPGKALILVDNTFMGPAFQHPFHLGADVVLYSATKFMSGFSDMIAGVALSNDHSLISEMFGRRVIFGNILPPDECWLLDSRLPTITLRMNRQSKNGQRIAERLARHPAVRKVYYPALFDDPEQIRIRDLQCDYPGSLFSLDLHGGKPAAFEFLRNVKLAKNAVSLGGMETLACHPRTTTHSELSERELDSAGIGEGLVRISSGIEDWRDLLADFQHALDTIAP
jgi:methionine-gamma-lyase